MTATYPLKTTPMQSLPTVLIDPATGLPVEKTLNDVVTAMGNVGVSRYPSTSFYKAIRNFTGATSGDVITNVVVLDVTNNTTISSVWRNKNTSADLATPPVIGTDVTYTTGDQLTDPQLRASPVPVSIDQTTPGTTESVTVKSSGGIGPILGALLDTPAADGEQATSASHTALLKGLFKKLLGSIAVTGTFWQASQPVRTGVNASDSVIIYPDELTQTIARNGDGSINYVAVTTGGNTYRQTYGYTTGALTSISNWVKQ